MVSRFVLHLPTEIRNSDWPKKHDIAQNPSPLDIARRPFQSVGIASRGLPGEIQTFCLIWPLAGADRKDKITLTRIGVRFMSLREKINGEVKAAMKARESFRLATLRMLTATKSKQFEVDKRVEPTEDDIITIMTKAAKQRRESIEAAEKFGRAEMADNEKAELKIITEFLPAQLSEDELAVIIDKAHH